MENKYICVLDTVSNVCNIVEPYKPHFIDFFTSQDLQSMALQLISILGVFVGYVVIVKAVKAA